MIHVVRCGSLIRTTIVCNIVTIVFNIACTMQVMRDFKQWRTVNLRKMLYCKVVNLIRTTMVPLSYARSRNLLQCTLFLTIWRNVSFHKVQHVYNMIVLKCINLTTITRLNVSQLHDREVLHQRKKNCINIYAIFFSVDASWNCDTFNLVIVVILIHFQTIILYTCCNLMKWHIPSYC